MKGVRRSRQQIDRDVSVMWNVRGVGIRVRVIRCGNNATVAKMECARRR